MTVMPLREWLKPPQNMLVALSLLTLMAVSSLGWFGWRLLQQEQAAAEERRQEQLELTADRVAEKMRGILAETRERLSVWTNTSPPERQPEDGVFLSEQRGGLFAVPQGRLLYWPVPSPDPEAPPDAFAYGERLEFKQQEAQAEEWYRRLAGSHVLVSVRAGALMRQARVLRKLGRKKEAVEVYLRLSSVSHVKVAGVPAELVASHELCEMLRRPADADLLKRNLLLGRWRISRGQFEFYWSEATRLSGHGDLPPSDLVTLSDAAAAAWKEMPRDPAAPIERNLWMDGKPFLALWQSNAGNRALLVLPIESLLLRPISTNDDAVWAIVDNDGKVLAGKKDGVSRAAVRTAAEIRLPWTLYVTGLRSAQNAGPEAQKRFVLAAVTIMMLFLLAGSYFIARAIRREMEISRLQTNFVAAVSHEFRSPLTSMRQLSEILAEGRAPNEERRHMYYETLVHETGRLQRLVETLLDFGRMEAGARRYQVQKLEASDVAKQVTAEFEQQISDSGRRIELSGPREQCAIEADPEALCVALRNLVDNALKYSPNCPGIWVEWGREDGYVAIRVRDRGAGISSSERKMIFQKFVRGSAAASGKVKGMGVGLTIASQIVAAHRGEIRVVSEPGQGSTFTLLLPAADKI